MDKHYFIKLLHKYFKQDLTIEERQYVENYYDLFQNEPDVLDTLSNKEKEALRNEIKNAVWSDIAKNEQQGKKVWLLQRGLIKYTAVAAIFAMLVTGFYFLFDRPEKRKVIESAGLVKNAALVIKQPKENRVIFLPDGSTVILSAGSKLNYPTSFEGMGKREVFLDGQAFFDIRHNASLPFIVHTAKLEITVLGTAFNIKALPGETDIVVTVKRGKVKVADQGKTLGIITPDQQITYNRKSVNSIMKHVDSDKYLDWKEQDLLLDNLTLAEAAQLLEKKYNVKIAIEDRSIISQRFTATFTKNNTLEQALKSICVFNGVIYKYDKDKSAVSISKY